MSTCDLDNSLKRDDHDNETRHLFFTPLVFMLVAVVILLLLGPSTKIRVIGAELAALQVDTKLLIKSYQDKQKELGKATIMTGHLEREIRQNEVFKRDLALAIKAEVNGPEIYNNGFLIMKRMSQLQSEIQSISRREALESFGPGPYRIKIVVAFLDENGKALERGSFTVELASLDHMPHSVEHFLKMVDQKLWDNTALVRQANHIIHASPTDYVTTESVRQQFIDAGLTQLAFQ